MAWRSEIVGCLAHAEAVIDFGEDEEDCNDEVYRKVETR
jgi:tRNA U34 5-carboxymethylaminomethyl modifying GTPase MnmE/TrmE